MTFKNISSAVVRWQKRVRERERETHTHTHTQRLIMRIFITVLEQPLYLFILLLYLFFNYSYLLFLCTLVEQLLYINVAVVPVIKSVVSTNTYYTASIFSTSVSIYNDTAASVAICFLLLFIVILSVFVSVFNFDINTCC